MICWASYYDWTKPVKTKAMKLNKELIKKLANGDVALNAFPVTDLVKEIVNDAFPGGRLIYKGDLNKAVTLVALSSIHTRTWGSFTDLDLRILNPDDFLIKEWKPVRGEMVEMRDTVFEEWDPVIFLSEIEGAEYPYTSVANKDEEEFKEGRTFEFVYYREIRQIPQVEEMTVAEVCKEFRKELGRTIKIVEG